MRRQEVQPRASEENKFDFYMVRERQMLLWIYWVCARLLECGQAISEAPGKTRGWGWVQLCANDMCSTPASFSPATLLRPLAYRKNTASTEIGISNRSKEPRDSIWLSTRDHNRLRRALSPYASEPRSALQTPCTRVIYFHFALLFGHLPPLAHSPSDFRRTVSRLPAASRTTVPFPPHSLFA